MGEKRIISVLTMLGLAICGVALHVKFGWRGTGAGAGGETARTARVFVAWRVPAGCRAGRPCPCPGGWVAVNATGGVMKVSFAGRVLWRAAFAGEEFAGASVTGDGRIAVASDSGRVFALDSATGVEVWRRETGARFRQPPLSGARGGEPVLWLVSQEDGRLFCLRAADGSVIWTGEETNRCDGEPAAWSGRIAYGNCDGAVYVFDADDGKRVGKIAVGDEDQMAGGILVLADGRLVTGTRAGRLVMLDPAELVCAASAEVSESEAFATPAACFGGLVAMGTDEGNLTLWRVGAKELQPAGRFALGGKVTSLVASKDRLFALAGGTLVVIVDGRETGRLSLGDDVGPLAIHAAGDVACVADGVLVCVKGDAK